MNESDNPAISRLFHEGKEITLIATAHVSKESADLVERVIDEQKPDTVCVELCQSRYRAIMDKDRWQNMDIVKVVKEKKAFLLLSNLLLAAFQRRIAEKLDVKPGEEMIRAIQSAEKCGAHVHTADRDIRITLSRTWRIIGFFTKIKLLFQMILSLGDIEEIDEKQVEEMKQADMLETVLADVGKSLPEVKRVLIDERDMYLAEKIKTAPGERIVAVVGAGHVPGIKARWEDRADLAALETIPPKRRWTNILKWLIPALIVGLMIGGFFWKGKDAGAQMATMWIAANGILAGIGAAAALGHPLTILSSILAAPLTSLNPMIAAGWVSGLVEAFSRKPKVKDLESLSIDILSVKGFWRNKVTRILLVVVFTNLGSTVGTMVALPLMLKVL